MIVMQRDGSRCPSRHRRRRHQRRLPVVLRRRAARTTSRRACRTTANRATEQAEQLFWRVIHGISQTGPGGAAGDDEGAGIDRLRARAAEKERRRRKRRSPEEFQGRAGAFPQIEEDAEDGQGEDGAKGKYGGEIDGVRWEDVVEFFEPQAQEAD